MTGEYLIETFAQCNPLGPELDNVPALLRRVADTIEELGQVHILDIVHRKDIIAEGYWHFFTVYFNRNPDDIASSAWSPVEVADNSPSS